MGEIKKSIFNIGSPDLDVILKKKLPILKSVKKRYSINFKKYCILIWHPVTSNIHLLKNDTIKVIYALKKFNRNVVVIYPNNDPGCEKILKIYNELNNKRFKILKSIRFENFISLLKNSEFIFGNSSSAIYEAPILGIPSFNIGDRQHKRVNLKSIKNLDTNNLNLKIIEDFLKNYKPIKKNIFGEGNSDKKFLKITTNQSFWRVSTQKFFNENKLY